MIGSVLGRYIYFIYIIYSSQMGQTMDCMLISECSYRMCSSVATIGSIGLGR